MKPTDRYSLALGAALALTLNRAAAVPGAAAPTFTLPADGWYQIGATGERPKELEMPGGKKVRIQQVVDAQDLATIANRMQAWAAEPGFSGLLVDFDHESADSTKSTRAAAWVMNAELRGPNQLWGQLRLSGSGRAALEGGDFLHFSPVLGFAPRDYAEGEVAHPIALLGGAFTNQPTFRGMLPLANRATDYPASPFPSQPTMKKDYVIALLLALGATIAADASPEAIDAAVQAETEKAKRQATEMAATKNRLLQLEGEQIERDLDAHRLTGDAREKAKGFLTNNREEGLAFIAAISGASGDYARTHNRSGQAQPPSGDVAAAAALDARRDTAVRAYQTLNRCGFQDAWEAVRTEKPELFATTR